MLAFKYSNEREREGGGDVLKYPADFSLFTLLDSDRLRETI